MGVLNVQRCKRYNKKPVAYKITKNLVKYALKEINKNKTTTMDDLLSKIKSKSMKIYLKERIIEMLYM